MWHKRLFGLKFLDEIKLRLVWSNNLMRSVILNGQLWSPPKCGLPHQMTNTPCSSMWVSVIIILIVIWNCHTSFNQSAFVLLPGLIVLVLGWTWCHYHDYSIPLCPQCRYRTISCHTKPPKWICGQWLKRFSRTQTEIQNTVNLSELSCPIDPMIFPIRSKSFSTDPKPFATPNELTLNPLYLLSKLYESLVTVVRICFEIKAGNYMNAILLIHFVK